MQSSKVERTLPALNQLKPGSILMDRYAIQGVIGVGGMGSVYRARDLHFPSVNKLVAVKEMIIQSPDPATRQTAVKNFEREANILATLSHPAIPKIFDYFTCEERSYLVLEFVDGKDLEAMMKERKQPFSEEQVIAWGIEICDVLDYLHSYQPEPIIFRDMKPSNVMINGNNHVVLVDFGIAKNFRIGIKGTMVGTEGYSPPEQYRGEATQQADIYALGATLHHLLTGSDPRQQAPFSFHERPARKLNPNVSVELDAVIQVALKYNPEERFPSARTMKEALMMVASKTGAFSVPAAKGAAHEQTVKPVWIFRCEDEIRSSAAVGEGIAYIGSYDHQLYALRLMDGQLLWKHSAEGGIASRPCLYQGMVYAASEDQKLYALDAASGKPVWSTSFTGPIRSSPVVFEGYLFAGGDDGCFRALNPFNGQEMWRFEAGSPIRSTPSAGNGRIFFGTEDGSVYCLDLRGQTNWRFSAKRAVTASPFFQDGIVYTASLDGFMYALDSSSGWGIWRFRMGKGSVSSPCGDEGAVYFGSADGHLYAVDTNNAKELWHFAAGGQVSGSPVLHQGSIYCGAASGDFFCLEAKSGRLRWKYSTGGPITSAPAVANRLVLIGSTDRTLYAFPVV